MTNLKTLEIWTAQSICDVGILLSVVAWLFALGRPYFASTREALPLKIAADIWWMWYVIAKDGALFAAFLAGLWTLNLDLMADIKIGLPFVPAGTVLMAAALALKVAGRGPDDSPGAATALGAAAVLNLIGYVFVMEGPGHEYPAASQAVWQTLLGWRSNANPTLSMWTFTGAFSLLVLIAVWTAVSLRRAGPHLTSARVRGRAPAKAG